MKLLKKLLKSIEDRNLDLQERLFRLLGMIGLCGLIIGIIDSIVIGEAFTSVAVLLIALVFSVILFAYSLRFHRIQLGATILGVAMIFLVLPFTFLTSGGIYGGAPIWLLFGAVYVCLVIEGRAKYILLAGSVIIDTACYYIAYAHPARVIQHTLATAYIDSLVSLVVIAVLTCGMIIFQNAIYRSENAIAREQKQEIEDMVRAQNHFFSSMSHEIRTPLNTILGLNELILREAVTEAVSADAAKIQAAGKMLLTLINDFLDMSKMQSGRMDIMNSPYDVGAMLSDIVNMIWVRAKEKGLEFHVDVDQMVPAQLIGDEVRIKQILLNVLNNAVKYTKTGSVSLTVQSKGRPDGSAQVIYIVRDTGIGIKKESIPNLFNAFKRVEEEGIRYIEGTGLGLSIVKQLLDLMGGDIAVNSVYTKGSTFVITIPQGTVDEARLGHFNLESRRGTMERYKQSFEAPKAHVLIVDDNEANLMVADKLLRDTKVQIDTVSSGAACLEKTLRNRYDVILMDHLMPEMDGIECLHAIREQTGGLNQNAPVVVLTANAGEEYRLLYQKEGFDSYLLKPIDGKQLETAVLRHLPRELVTMAGEEQVGIVESPIVRRIQRKSILISTDSVCDLPRELVERHQIAVMPYLVRTESGEFLDGIETETDGILSYMDDRAKLAKSEAPEVSAYEEFFAEQLIRAQYIVHITMAQHVSEGYARAMDASKAFDNVIVVDSGHLSSGMGLMVLHAAKRAGQGLGPDAIVSELEGLRPRVRTSFIVDSTEYLARSGRIASGLNKVCMALMLHPVLVLKNSGMKVGAIRVGARDRARAQYIASILKNKSMIDTDTLFITYTGLTREELAAIEEQVEKRVHFQKIILQKASPAISTNCGSGSFGLLFMMKQ